MTGKHCIAITGASGFLGGALVKALPPEANVRILSRREWNADSGRKHLEVVLGDLEDDAALARLVEGVDTVFHCAAHMGKGNPRASWRINVDGTAGLARAAAHAGVDHFIYVSSISVFGATRTTHGIICEKNHPERLDRLNPYARTKYQGEVEVRRIGSELGLGHTIVRPTNVYGPRSRPWFEQYARLLRRIPVAFGRLSVDVVYVDDVVDGLLRTAARSPGGKVFHFGHERVPLCRFMSEVGRVIGREPRTLPRSLDRAVRLAIDWSYRLATGTEMSMSLVRELSYPHMLAYSELGYDPRVKLTEGFRRIAAAYRAPGVWAGDREGPVSRLGYNIMPNKLEG